jgi:TPR repeat protein
MNACIKNLLFGTLSVFAVNSMAEDTHMWESEYQNKVQSALHALHSKNYVDAKRKLLATADLGNKQAQYHLAQMYLNGWGSEPDYELGWMWLNVAMEQQTVEWRETFRKIKRVLPEDFIVYMEPKVAKHIEQYGAKAKDLRCIKKNKIGSHIKEVICEKRFIN